MRVPVWDLVRRVGWRADLIATGLGALSAAALPPLHIIPVLLIAIPGLLALIAGSRNGWIAARRGFWFGFAHHVFGLYWITEAILFEAARFWWVLPFAVPAIAAVLAMFIAAPCWLAWRARAALSRLLILSGGWVFADIARQYMLTGFPWNPLGSVWAIPGAVGDVYIQPAAYIGVTGLTLLTLLWAGLPTLGRQGWMSLILMLSVWAGVGKTMLAESTGPAPGIKVALVQGAIEEGGKFDRSRARDLFLRHLDLTRQGVAAAQGAPVVVVWPETASTYLLEIAEGARDAIAQTAGALPALIGGVRFDARRRPRNSLFVIDGAAPPAAVYDKWHLVPFGEYVPDWLPLPIQVIPGAGFAPGPGPRTLHPAGVPAVAPIICYEAIFSGEIIDHADQPDWIVNVTNDAWFGNSAGPRQHLAAARLRAVEEGLPLMRAANTGITAGFDAHGHELGRLPRVKPGVLLLDLPGRTARTLFSRYGLIVPCLLAALSLVAGALLSRRR
jgi:apolipoprotein N-acyltransferase